MTEASRIQSENSRASVPLLQIVRARRWLLATSVGLGIIAGLLAALARPSLFAAAATLIITPADPSPTAQAEAMANARALLENRTIAETVIAQQGLRTLQDALTPEALIQERLSVAPIRDTDNMRVSLTLRTRERVGPALLQLVQLAIKRNSELIQQEIDSAATTFMKEQRAEARAALTAAADRLLAAQRATGIEQLRADADLYLVRRTRVRELSMQIATERARLAHIERQLAERPRIFTAPRSARGEGPLMQHSRRAVEGASGADVGAGTSPEAGLNGQAGAVARESVRGAVQQPATEATSRSNRDDTWDQPFALPLGEPSVDPVYEALDYLAATSRAKLAGLQAQRAAILKDAESPPLSRLYAAEMQLGQLEIDRDLAVAAYKRLSERHDAARDAAVHRSFQMRLADPPTSYANLVSPSVTLNAAVGGLLGLLCGATIIFFGWQTAELSIGSGANGRS